MLRHRLWWIAGVVWLLASCGGDDKNTGDVSGSNAVLQVNCPGSGTGTGGLTTPTTRVGGTATGTTCPTCRAGTCLTCQAKSRQLQGIPVSGDSSIGDTRITNDIDCGDITIQEPAPVVAQPAIITPVIITP